MAETRWAPDRHVVHYTRQVGWTIVRVEKYGNNPTQGTLTTLDDSGVESLTPEQMESLADSLREAAEALRGAS